MHEQHKPATGTQDAVTAAFPCTGFVSWKASEFGWLGSTPVMILELYHSVLPGFLCRISKTDSIPWSHAGSVGISLTWEFGTVEVQQEGGHWVFSMIKDSESNSPLESWISLTLRMMTLLLLEFNQWGACNVGVTGSSWYIDRAY